MSDSFTFSRGSRLFREHSGNTRERPDSVFPVPPPYGGHGNGRGNVPGTDVLDHCPVCGKGSTLDTAMDRYFHDDGSSNDTCWRALLRGGLDGPPPLVPHALYRFWAGKELLYIGITLNPTTRWRDHAVSKPWWHEITSITIERIYGRDLVLKAEKNAIRSERPKYNVTWNRS